MSTHLTVSRSETAASGRPDAPAAGWHPIRWIKDHLSPGGPAEAVKEPAPAIDAPRSVTFYAPTFTLRQGPAAFVIQARLSGVKPGDLEIEAKRGWLTIRGKRSDECELDIRTFDHSYVLPPEVDRESIQATYKRGLLTVVLRIPASWKTRRVPLIADG